MQIGVLSSIFAPAMLTFILAQSSAGMTQVIMMLAIFIVFYFFMIRPQQQKAKEAKKFIEEIKPGDKVVTLGGMHGKVVSLSDLTVVLEIDRGLKATFDRGSINMESSKKMQAEEAK
jgi:preprotein translocase subunit YajC